MTPDEQLRLWVEGTSVHNHDRWIGKMQLDGGECCPDFSCCHPELQAPREVREAFSRASSEERNRYLGGFLGALVAAKSDERVHVAGRDPREEC